MAVNYILHVELLLYYNIKLKGDYTFEVGVRFNLTSQMCL